MLAVQVGDGPYSLFQVFGLMQSSDFNFFNEAVSSHLKITGHTASFCDFEIYSYCSDDSGLMIYEDLLISSLSPVLMSRAVLFHLTFFKLILPFVNMS